MAGIQHHFKLLGIGCSIFAFAAMSGTAAKAADNAAASEANAQPAADAVAEASEDDGHGDIVVTARRKEESLGRTPVAISVLTSEALEERSIASQADLQVATPGLVVRTTQGSNGFNYAIRGQSVDAFSASQPSVLTYVNEFQSTSLSAGSFYDLSNIQVLKGPQGTLFGRNTTGGAVLYTTARPEFGETSGLIRGRVGNLRGRYMEGMVNASVSETLAIRAAGSWEQRRGFVQDIVDGEYLNDIDRHSFRLSVRWQPSDRFETSFVGETGRSEGEGDAMLLFSAYAPGEVGPDGQPLPATVGTFYSQMLDTLAGPGAYAALLAAYPGTIPEGFDGFADLQRAWGNRKTASDALTGRVATNKYLINTTTFSVSDDAQIKNIIGYSKNYSYQDQDQDGTPFPFFDYVHFLNQSRTWSEELQISGKAFDGRFDYIAGLYYSNEKKVNGQDFQYFNLGPVANPILGPGFGVPSLPLRNALKGGTSIESVGAFVQASYDFGDLSLTGGFRYTEEKTEFTSISGFQPAFPVNVQESRKDGKPSWTVGLEYEATDSLFLYGSYRGSWRGGGYNYNAPPVNELAVDGGNTFDPETIEDVELGAKFYGDVGGRSARLNIAAFHSWVSDVQRIAYISIPPYGPAGVTLNLPGARFKGVEIDGEIEIADWLKVGGAFTYTDAKYKDDAPLDLFGTYLNFSTFADLAKYSGSAFVQAGYELPGDGGTLTFRGDVYAQSAMYISNYGKTGAPETLLPAYEVVNLRAGWDDIGGGPISAAFYVKNLFDKEYFTGGIGLGAQSGYNLAVPAEPRIFGFELTARF